MTSEFEEQLNATYFELKQFWDKIHSIYPKTKNHSYLHSPLRDTSQFHSIAFSIPELATQIPSS